MNKKSGTSKDAAETLIRGIKRKSRKLDLSRFDAALLIAFIAAKETHYGSETDGRIPG